eukprot:13948-Heterococcus_DN1.PRE.5
MMRAARAETATTEQRPVWSSGHLRLVARFEQLELRHVDALPLKVLKLLRQIATGDRAAVEPVRLFSDSKHVLIRTNEVLFVWDGSNLLSDCEIKKFSIPHSELKTSSFIVEWCQQYVLHNAHTNPCACRTDRNSRQIDFAEACVDRESGRVEVCAISKQGRTTFWLDQYPAITHQLRLPPSVTITRIHKYKRLACQCACKCWHGLLRVCAYSYLVVLSNGHMQLVDPMRKTAKPVVNPQALGTFGAQVLSMLRILLTGAKNSVQWSLAMLLALSTVTDAVSYLAMFDLVHNTA